LTMRPGRFLLQSLSFFTLILLALVTGPDIAAQDEKGETSQLSADSLVIVPIPATRISAEYNESAELVSRSGKIRLTETEIEELEEQIDTVFALVDHFLKDSILQKLDGANIRELDNARNLVNIQIDHITGFQTVLTRRSQEIEEATVDLAQTGLRWQLTREQADARGIPQALQNRMEQILGQIDSVNLLLQEDFNRLLVGEDALASRNNQLRGIQDSISNRKIQIGESLFIVDMPRYFADLSMSEDMGMIRHHLEELNKAFQSDLDYIKNQFKMQIWIIVVMMVILTVLAFWFKEHYRKLIPEEQFELTDIHLTIIESPLAASLFIAILLIRFLFSEFAGAMQSIDLFILMVPMIIIMLRRQSKYASPWIEFLMVFYFLTFFYELLFVQDLLQRSALLFLSLGGSAFFFMMILKKTVILDVRFKFVYRLLRVILGLFTLMCFIAIFANLLGAFRMAEYFTLAFMQITTLFLVVYVTTRVVDAVVFLLLVSKFLQNLYLVRDGFKFLHRKITTVINFLLWIYFILATLELLNLKDGFLEWGDKTLNTGWKVGAVDITPASILVFIFVIWLSVFLARVITSILEKDVFTRITISKGMPNTISMLLRIALISGGFFLAAAAAGMQLSNLSIIIGAFSVGIGFGLQNIFNNMVSGLILAFERPIKVGDTVEVGTLIGIVKKISFRSSTIKTYDGSEVIVPNGNLISDSMTNWTLTDYLRRMDIRVGVAYGTDPEVVLELLEGIAVEHEKVRKKPQPSVFFIGFGDSSLDFRLLAWTDIDHRLGTESELRVAINKKLDEAGIEIPFPQRDLHIRSDDTKD